MNLQDAINLSNRWGDKPCEHPSLERESNMGFSTGDYVCTQCGRNVDRDDWANKQNQRNSNEAELELIVHAEQNAIIAAGSKANGATIYVWGKPVCARCAGAIIQAGIKRVVALNPDSVGESSNWYKTGKFSIEMFKEANVHVDFFTVNETDCSCQTED